MTSVVEALGLTLPGAASIPSVAFAALVYAVERTADDGFAQRRRRERHH